MSELIESHLVENGRPVRLHFVFHRPKGIGPFPLLLFNHGSTGRPTQSTAVKDFHTYQPIAEHYVKRGWMVAIPHRRGRGDSDGIYDEGLDKAGGYSCDADIALRGADRASTDLAAAMDLLVRRPDVDPSRIVLGGHSRGGILSIAFAGKHPRQFKGVLNFVGGWLGEGCPSAFRVNSELARMGANYPNQTLWLCAERDEFYSVAHLKSVFREYVRSGGQGEFISFETGDHRLLWSDADWRKSVDDYTATLGYGEFSRR